MYAPPATAGCVMCTPKRVPAKEVPMAGPVTARFSDELHKKITAEAKQKECSVSQIIREKIELAYVQEDIKELKRRLGKMEVIVLEMAPQARRAEILSWWTLILLAEYIKSDSSVEKFWSIENTADEKYKDYLKDRKLKL